MLLYNVVIFSIGAAAVNVNTCSYHYKYINISCEIINQCIKSSISVFLFPKGGIVSVFLVLV